MRAILAKSLRDQRRAAFGWAIGLVGVAVLYSVFYPSIRDSAPDLSAYIDKLPDAFKNIIGTDFTSPAGYLRTELFSVMGPVLILVWAIGTGARATAGEEEKGTLDTLLSTPLRRRTVLAAKAISAVGVAAGLSAALFVVLRLLGPVFDLQVPAGDLAGACLLFGLLGLAFGSIALAIGAWTGHRGLAASVAGGYAAFSYILHALAPSVDALGPLHPLSPFRWYLDPDPLTGSLSLRNIAVLLAIASAGYVLAWIGFERRDLAT